MGRNIKSCCGLSSNDCMVAKRVATHMSYVIFICGCPACNSYTLHHGIWITQTYCTFIYKIHVDVFSGSLGAMSSPRKCWPWRLFCFCLFFKYIYGRSNFCRGRWEQTHTPVAIWCV
ncbi:unnamed protein product [Sphacelaria rigidula]